MTPFVIFMKNAASILGARAIDIGFRLVAVGIIARYLDLEGYGEYAFANTYVMFLVILSNMGVEEIVTRETARSPVDARRYFSGALAIRLAVIPIVSGIYVSSLTFLDIPFIVVVAIYFSIAVEVCISFMNLYFAVFRGIEHMEYELIVGLLINSLLLPAILLIRNLDLGFISLFRANLMVHIIALGVLSIIIYRTINVRHIRLDFKLGFSLIRSGYPLGISALLLVGSFHVDIFVLRYLRDASEVALFQLPYQIILRLLIVPMSLVTALFPILSRLSENTSVEKNGWFNTSVEQAYKLLMVISSIAIMFLLSFSDGIIVLLGGSAFLDAVNSFRILIWSIPFLFIDLLQSIVLVSLDKQRLLIIQSGICLLINFVLDIILVSFYGYLGAGIATLVSFLVRFIIGALFVNYYVDILNIWNAMLKTAICGIISGLLIQFIPESANLLKLPFGAAVFLSGLLLSKCYTINDLKLLKASLGSRLSHH